MLERLNAYVEYQDFCRPNDWPPIKELKTAISKDGQSCEFACLDKGLVCEPTFFPLINTRDTFKRAGMPCNASTIEPLDSILAPSMNTADNTCMLQNEALLFSCRAAKAGVVRICPCRSYRKEQVALCESCLGSWHHWRQKNKHVKNQYVYFLLATDSWMRVSRRFTIHKMITEEYTSLETQP